MDDDAIATLYAGGRIALGTALTLVPAVARPWLGPVASDADAQAAIRVAGVRDGLLGAAVWATRDAPEVRRLMVLLCALADTADAITTVIDVARTRRPGAALTAVFAAGGALTGFTLAHRLRTT